MAGRSLTAAFSIALAAIAVATTPSGAIQQRAPICECQPGYYHRRADANDMMCVTASSRAAAQAENAAAASHTAPGGNCLSGFVFRDAFDGDGVCVAPNSRSRVHAENRDPRKFADPMCYQGYFGDTNPNDG